MYDVKLIQQPTGRTHQVNGVYQPILDEATGEPEQEYVLVALVDEHYVPLQSFTVGFVQHQVGRPDTAAEQQSSSAAASSTSADAGAAGSAQPAAPAEGQGTAGEGAAQQPAPPAEPTG